ncbi:MAG: ATP-dependent DNA helicase [Ilumatobacteraceae bacterium]|jgi:ATP-dependent DNA helicase DinG|nr:ATP-dependent DNA helicase [Ilumatobacteraceae bacterium]
MTPAAASAIELLDTVIGRLSHAEQRVGQADMVRHVADAIDTGTTLVVQAGTGTGKTLGYLVPILAAGRTAVIATYTKALQDQLASVDLPLLEAACADRPDLSFSWAILKGRNNYLCRQRVSEIETGQDQLQLNDTPADVVREIRDLVAWADETETGEISDVPFTVGDSAWRKVSLGSDECPGAAKCSFGETCFTERARERAKNANVIVVNFTLYGLDLEQDREFLPDHDVVVFDEVHELEDVISETASVSLTGRMIATAAETARLALARQKLPNALAKTGKELDEVLQRYVGQRLPQPLPPDVEGTIGNAAQQCGLISDELRATINETPELLRAVSTITRMNESLDKVLTGGSNMVVFVTDVRGAARLTAAPKRVDRVLGQLWDDTTAILTSATIPPGLPRRLGLAFDDDDIVRVASPFDYEKQSLLYLADDLPVPNDAQRSAKLQSRIRELISLSGGSALVLFTSWSVLRDTADALDGKLGKGVNLYRQDDMPKKALLDAFRQDHASCLFATRGFFQGVDVPGDALRLVILDKVPFPAMNDPLLDARRDEAGSSAFMTVDVPIAAASLAQAAGRLIRTATDHGVVAILDPRLSTKRYKSAVLYGVSHMPETNQLSQVQEFFASRRT